MRILVIDEDSTIEHQLNTCTADHDWHLTTAHTDADALAALNSDADFDVAFVNIDSGDTAGLALFQQLVERSRRIPRVALSDGGDIARIKAALADGAADLLVKPLRREDVLATVERVMAQVERRRRNWRERGAYMALRREVDLAADMQRRILPTGLPADSGLDIAAMMQPARGVGGDFYDAFRIDEARIGVLIADVSGKGVPAAFYMAVASTTLRAVALRGVAPGAALSEANTYLVERNIPGMFVSVFYAVINTATWQVRCSNAGHSAPLLINPEAASVSPFDSAGGPILGILEDEQYAESTFELAPDGGMLLYTDGVSEAYNAAREQFGEERIHELVDAQRAAASRELIDSLDGALGSYSAGTEQHDDVTALAVRRLAS